MKIQIFALAVVSGVVSAGLLTAAGVHDESFVVRSAVIEGQGEVDAQAPPPFQCSIPNCGITVHLPGGVFVRGVLTSEESAQATPAAVVTSDVSDAETVTVTFSSGGTAVSTMTEVLPTGVLFSSSYVSTPSRHITTYSGYSSLTTSADNGDVSSTMPLTLLAESTSTTSTSIITETSTTTVYIDSETALVASAVLTDMGHAYASSSSTSQAGVATSSSCSEVVIVTKTISPTIYVSMPSGPTYFPPNTAAPAPSSNITSISATTSFHYSPFIGMTNTRHSTPTNSPSYPNTTFSSVAISTAGGVATSTAVFTGGSESKDKNDAGLFAFILAIAGAAYLL